VAVAVASAKPYASLHLAPDRYHASTTPLIFYRPDALPALKAQMQLKIYT